MSEWFARSEIIAARRGVEKRLKLPAAKVPKGQEESATQFWARVEEAGLLVEAMAHYDEIAAEYASWTHTRRETKKAFAERIEREGRQAKVERERKKLLASGLSNREVQEKLVRRFQPLDGSETRVWPTPNPWSEGRLFRSKAEQERILALAGNLDEEQVKLERANWLIECAKWRREERTALASARARAKALKESASDADD